jgi:DNA mismatch repair protein MSH6
VARPTKFDRVVAREICQVTTKGTRIFTVVDGESKEATSKYLLALSEKENNNGFPVYGVCFVDTSIGTFYIGQFPDDRHSSRLRTLIAAYAPAQVCNFFFVHSTLKLYSIAIIWIFVFKVLYERNHISKQTEVILNTSLVTALKESLAPETEFWNSTDTLMKLAENGYFSENGMPENLKKFIGEGVEG